MKCFTLRIPDELDEFVREKALAWKSTKNAALVRIINEYMQNGQDNDKGE